MLLITNKIITDVKKLIIRLDINNKGKMRYRANDIDASYARQLKSWSLVEIMPVIYEIILKP